MVVEGGLRLLNKSSGGKAIKDLKGARRAALAELTGVEEGEEDDPSRAYDNQLEIHPFFGYVHNETFPQSNNFGFSTPYDFVVRPDGYHIKNAEKKEKPPLTVGIFGGSYAAYIGYDPKPLEEMLQKSFPDRQPYVVAMAVGGHALPQTGYIYQYFRSMFDVVIFIDGLNELWNPWENNNSGLPPEYAKAAHFQYKLSLAEMTPERFLLTNQIIELKQKRIALAERSLKQPARQLVLTHKLWEGMDSRMTQQSYDAEKSLKDTYLTKDRFVRWGVDDSFEFSATQWGQWHRILQAVCDQNDATFLHYLQPNPHVPDSKRVVTPEEEHAVNTTFDIETYVVEGYPYLRQEMAELEAEGAKIHDLCKIYYDEEGDIWFDAAHPVQRGQILVQERLAADIATALEP